MKPSELTPLTALVRTVFDYNELAGSLLAPFLLQKLSELVVEAG